MIIRICRIVAFVLIGTIYSHAHQVNFESPKVMLGIDVLRESKFEIVRGMRVGLLTNYTGRASTL